jgi:hypothetical protein
MKLIEERPILIELIVDFLPKNYLYLCINKQWREIVSSKCGVNTSIANGVISKSTIEWSTTKSQSQIITFNLSKFIRHHYINIKNDTKLFYYIGLYGTGKFIANFLNYLKNFYKFEDNIIENINNIIKEGIRDSTDINKLTNYNYNQTKILNSIYNYNNDIQIDIKSLLNNIDKDYKNYSIPNSQYKNFDIYKDIIIKKNTKTIDKIYKDIVYKSY